MLESCQHTCIYHHICITGIIQHEEPVYGEAIMPVSRLLKKKLWCSKVLLGHMLQCSDVGALVAGLPPPPKILLMSATADAQLFAEYFSRAGTEALLLGGMSAGSITATTGVDGKRHQQQMEHGLSVGLLSIPGFTHPVQQLWLEDALQATGIVVGKQSK